MSMNRALLNNSQRLGISDDCTIKKADEFLRILQSKNTLKTISDTSKIILCLDLATTHLGLNFDKEAAIKLSGLKKTIYQNSLNNLEKILNLEKKITIAELCVQFNCTIIQGLAEDIIKNYRNYDEKIKDINHPQYPAAAVYTACKLKNIKIDNSKFVIISRLKTTQWKELINEFDKFTKSLGLVDKYKTKTDETIKFVNREEIVKKPSSKCVEIENQIEEYEVWRERILKEASEELLKQTIGN